MEQRWDTTDFDKLKGVPWNLRPKARCGGSLPVRIQLPAVEGRLTPEPTQKLEIPEVLQNTKSFSAMPPVEAWKVLCALLVSKRCDKAGNKRKAEDGNLRHQPGALLRSEP